MKKLELLTCSIPRDLALTRLALDGVKKYFDVGSISVVTPSSAFTESRRMLGSEVELLDERDFAGGVSLDDLQTLTQIEGFPERAGWYLQQLAKLGFAFHGDSDGYYLIWDSDTVPLRPVEFFTDDGRPYYTLSDERHAPYFETYERLLGERPTCPASFIAQHMVIDRKIAREMLEKIAGWHPDQSGWSGAIMSNLAPVKSLSLFSEYETYGNFVYSRYPGSIALRRLPWLREGSARTRTTQPTQRQLEKLARTYCFAAFEAWQLPKKSEPQRGWRRLLQR